MPENGGAVPSRQARRQRGGGRRHIAVLDRIRAGAVAILEVDPQVLDRFGGELAAHARHDLVVAHQLGEQAAVRVERGERFRAPVRDERSRDSGRRRRRRCAPAGGRLDRRGTAPRARRRRPPAARRAPGRAPG